MHSDTADILPSSSPSSVSSKPIPKHRRIPGDWLVVFAIAIFILFGCFGRTVVSQKVISNLGVLSVEDTLFNNEIRFVIPRPRFDPSLYQFHIPFQLYAAKELRRFQIPLWNPCFGCGFPTFAELQYCTFSPLRGLFSASNKYLYNLGIVIKALIAALGTFYLARRLSASRGASAFAAISYGLCPFILRELELPNEVELFPVVACAFLCFANRSTLGGRFLLGFCAALTVVCMHPEFAFLSVVFAIIILSFAKPITANTTEPSSTTFLPFKAWFQNLLIAGLIGCCLAAPLLLPFLELLSSAESYKFHDTFIQKVPMETLLVGLLTPICKGGSPFLGVVALALAVFAAVSSGRRLAPLSVTAVLLILWISAPGPLASVVAAKPFSYIPPRYFLAPLLLFMSLLAAHGLDIFSNSILLKQWKRLIPLAFLAIVLAAAPYVLGKFNPVLPGFDGTLPAPSLVPQIFIKGAFALSVLLLIILLSRFIKSSWATAIPYLLLLANLFSLGDATRLALPPTISFDFKSTPALDVIKASGERMTACGWSFLIANTSMVYDIRDYRSTGPVTLKCVDAFREIESQGKSPGMANTMPSALLDAASVKYIVSRWPLCSADEKQLVFKPINAFSGAPHAVLDQMALLDVHYRLTESGELFIRTGWKARTKNAYYYAATTNIVSQDGKIVRRGAMMPLFLAESGDKVTHEVSLKVPESKGEKLYAVLHLSSLLNGAQLPIHKLDLPIRANGIELLDLSKISSQTGTASATPNRAKRLELVCEDTNQILLYKNNQALPQAYLSNNILKANSLNEARAFLSSASFDPHLQTIVETSQTLENDKPGFLIPATTDRKNSSTIIVRANAPSDCYLILTDTYFNGWCAFLDEKPAKIERANVCFRAVKIPKGMHTIRFQFVPLSLLAGIAIAALCLLVVGLMAWLNLRATRTRQ